MLIHDLFEFRRLAALHAQSSDRIKVHQVLGLRDVMKGLFDVPFYGDRFRRKGTRPGDLRTVKDLAMLPSPTAAEFAAWLAPRTEAGTAAHSASAAEIALDPAGRVLAVPPGIDRRARRLHLFAVLAAWGAGARTPVEFTSADDFGLGLPRDGGAGGGLLFRARRAVMGSTPPAGSVVIADPGKVAFRSGDATGARAILGDALFGPFAWECSAGAFHPVAARAVLEAVTGTPAARGLTGGSRASRAPRESGELYLTLIENSAFPVFRVPLGLRGRFDPAGCACGVRTERIVMETPFLGPLRLGDGVAFDPQPILRAAASAPGVRRAALLQSEEDLIRVLIAVGDGGLAATPGGEIGSSPVGGAVAFARDEAVRRIDALGLPSRARIRIECAAEADLPFPERGFVHGLSGGPLLTVGGSET